MDFGGFVIEGSRPPSVQSSYRPHSARSKHGYHTVSYQSSVDETLFGSHHSSKLDDCVTDFKAPWEYPKPKPMGRTFAVTNDDKAKTKQKPKTKPLLWAPDPAGTIHFYKKRQNNQINMSSSISQGQIKPFWNTRDNFRQYKHTSTYVDESLFGKKLEEPSFDAPWNEKPKFKLDLRHVKLHPNMPRQRPKTAIGVCGTKDGELKQTAVWKP